MNKVVLAAAISVACGLSYAESDVPRGWMLSGSDRGSYRLVLDESVHVAGQRSARLESTQVSSGFGTVMQAVLADEYRGKRIRVRGHIKVSDVQSWAGLWLRVDAPSSMVSLDNMFGRQIKGTVDWQAYEVVADVPQHASAIAYGLLLDGSGKAWLDEVSVEIVGMDVALTSNRPANNHMFPLSPANLGFEGK